MKQSRRKFLKLLGLTAVGSCATVVGGYEYGKQIEANRLVLEQLQIPIENLRPALDGFRIIQMSDIHLYPYTQLDFAREAVAFANNLQPDLTVLTGDYVLETADAIFDLAPVLASLEAKYGVFASVGNHDLWTNIDVVRLGFKEQGLPVLENESVDLAVNGDILYLAGVDDGWSGRPDLAAALAKVPAGAQTILLAHEPDLVDHFSRDPRVSLQLSGHSHGGQVRLPFVGAPVLPYLGEKYDQGLYRVNETWLYTNRGLGLIMPVRLNCPPEITEITLVRA